MIKWLIAAVAIIVFILVCYRGGCTQYTQKTPHPQADLFPGVQLPSIQTQQKIYGLLRLAMPILNRAGVQTWMTGGSMLGAVRCQPGGIIPWDDDIDMGYDDRQTPLLESLQPKLAKKGLVLSETWFGYKIYPRGSNGKPPPFIDLFPTEFRPDGTARFARFLARKMWPKDSFRVAELFPLRRYSFGNTFLTGAAEPTEYLNRLFGPDWRTKAVVNPPHMPEVCAMYWCTLDHVTFTIAPEQYVSAPDYGKDFEL